MTKYYKNQESSVFYKIISPSEALQVIKDKNSVGIAVISSMNLDPINGYFSEINQHEFVSAYSEVKREMVFHNALQEEEKEIYLSEVFQQWADSFFLKNKEHDVIKEKAIISMKEFSPKIMGNFSSNTFKKQTKSWCSHNGYKFEDRILKLVNGKTTEHIRVTPLH